MLNIGMIDYVNLLPFNVFINKYIKSSRIKATIRYKSNVPSSINKQLQTKKINEAFVSSITLTDKSQLYYPLGIIAKKEVKSVLVIEGNEHIPDNASQTSNKLAQILDITGQVIIGDKALKYTCSNNNYTDLAKVWYEKYNLPFVFAVFAVNTKTKANKKLVNKFIKSNKIYIPRYILNKYAKQNNIKVSDILKYLKLISYTINYKEKRSLNQFLKLAQK
ncbi:MAG: Menaquinone via 6-amino-6-deoxyfutalosine step 1 [uncultured Campylobacterales bacterium]|uniref:Chorismate dehydratase n=1 Tax=uncultured Campylobacterales bacterium TaxID=352960 RepID=A0A6S6SPA3_9BACT|nr:MAG: Menaquinone via 6-amino-6-deoxyfutalosine step 1 [uncultured Campylobacterales bacterium]